jgi:putative molybdopterin biosynthesis protein
MTDLMTTGEVAAYLRIKERKVYDLIRAGRIPCSRAAGKWLFPKQLVDRWILDNVDPRTVATLRPPQPPAVIAGSHDPLLEWAIAESGCGLAILPGGSLDGIDRLASGEAAAALVHVIDPESGDYNVPTITRHVPHLDMVLLEWARRRQGLVVAAGNPLDLHSLADVRARRARTVLRQDKAGSHVLLLALLDRANLDLSDLEVIAQRARSETELGLAVLEDRADVGLAVEAVARRLRLDFVPLHEERCDLAVRRRSYFEPPFSRLLAFARSPAFARQAEMLGGYDLDRRETVHYNAE